MRKRPEKDNPNLCFVGGAGRTGTTILKKIFAPHPRVAAVPESRFAVDPDGLVDFYNTFSTGWSPYLFDVKVRRLERLLRNVGRRNRPVTFLRKALRRLGLLPLMPLKLSPRYAEIAIARHCPDYAELVDELLSRLTAFRFRGAWAGTPFLQSADVAYARPVAADDLAGALGDFIRGVAASAARVQSASHYLEDNTWSILWFDKLLRLVPEARLVHVYRDPRDVVASLVRQPWAPSDAGQAALFHRDVMDRWRAVSRELPPDAFLEIPLEGLVSDTRAVLEKIAGFWDLEWNDALLRTKLNRAHVGRWEKDLTLQEQNRAFPILKDVSKRLGYLT